MMEVFDAFLAPGGDNAPPTIANAAELSHGVVEQGIDFMAESVADDVPSRIG
jgi:hypothetical protein